MQTTDDRRYEDELMSFLKKKRTKFLSFTPTLANSPGPPSARRIAQVLTKSI